MTASDPFSSLPDEVPSELSAEFERRVGRLLEKMQTDRRDAEYRVGKEMGLL